MSADEPQFLEIGEGRKRRRIAYRLAEGTRAREPVMLWLSGFLSDMASTKATTLAAWSRKAGLPALAFDYSGHGLSEGDLLQASIGDWLEEAEAVLALLQGRKCIAVGSSMGGWIALLLARKLSRDSTLGRLAGLLLIAPAWDMTERLMWHRMSDEIKAKIERDGVYFEPSLYGQTYPITKHLIEEGRSHLIGEGLLDLDLPVRILQGMHDSEVAWGHALDLVDLLCCDDLELTLIKDGDHRLSREQDLRRLEAVVAELVDRVANGLALRSPSDSRASSPALPSTRPRSRR